MVIFGAGASYDSVPLGSLPPKVRALLLRGRNGNSDWKDDSEAQYRPPLANELFEYRPFFGETLVRYKPLLNLAGRLRELGDKSIEAELEEIGGDPFSEHAPALLMARFYIKELLQRCSEEWSTFAMGDTNYARLLYWLSHWREAEEESICLVTFNYDTLIEKACEHHWYVHSNDLSCYVPDEPPWCLLKLHGSVDWTISSDAPVATGKTPLEHLFSGAPLDTKNVYRDLGNRSMQIFGKKHPLAPAIGIPLQNKTEFACPPSHQDRLVECIPQVDKLITIGWRGTENHFWKLWKDSGGQPVHLLVVNKDEESSQEVASHMSGRGLVQSTPPLYFPGDFSRFVRQPDVLKEWLRSWPRPSNQTSNQQ